MTAAFPPTTFNVTFSPPYLDCQLRRKLCLVAELARSCYITRRAGGPRLELRELLSASWEIGADQSSSAVMTIRSVKWIPETTMLCTSPYLILFCIITNP